jgi:polar amino acid transport system substrate-binding protein
MKSKLTKLATVLAASVFALSISACSPSGTDTNPSDEPSESSSETPAALETLTAGKLTIATGEPAYEPWVLNDDPASCEGFEAAVGCEIAARLGFAPTDVVWVRTGFEEAIAPGPKNFDLNLQQYSPTEERKESVDFSSAYGVFPQSVVVYADGKFADIKSVADLNEAIIGVPNGTTEQAEAIKLWGEDHVEIFNTLDDVVAALNAKQIDALVADVSTAYYISGAELENAKIGGILDGTQGSEVAALLDKDSPLTAAVSQAIDDLKADGTLAALQQKWLYDTSGIPTLK